MKTFWTVVIVIIVLGIVGYGGYKLYHHYTKPQAQTSLPVATHTNPMMKPSPSVKMKQNSVYKMTANSQLGGIMTDPKGMTVYTFAKDTTGVSNCSGQCVKLWPAYTAPSQTGTFPANIAVIKRTDGTFQYTWKGMPLYYYSKDTKAGDTNGNGFNGLWSVVKL